MSKLSLKKYLAMIAFWFIGIITVIGLSIYYKHKEGAEFDKTAVPYILEAVKEISLWDPAKAKAIMTPEIVATIPDEKFSRAMKFFSQLGSLKSIDKPSFKKAFIDQETDIGKQTIVEYNVDTLYENGEAEVNLKLLKRGAGFEVYNFNFRSEKLMPQEDKAQQ